jgi:protein-tyrosine kinase
VSARSRDASAKARRRGADKRTGSEGDPADLYSPELVTLGGAPIDQVEAVQALAAQIMAQQIEVGRRGLALCGASAGAGVTFVATNLAVALAQAGVSTMLIDANLRDPGVDRILPPQEDGPGLQQLLRSDQLERSDVTQPTDLTNLSVVYAGGVAEDASELIGTRAFAQLVESCLRDFEFTVIDTPPANRSADARAISKIVGYSLIVARRNQSFVDDLATLTRELGEDGALVIGALLNAA